MKVFSVTMASQHRRKAMYRTIWRWHFYAGLLCIPIIITLALSGALYLFKPQFEAYIDQPYQQITVSGHRTTANQQISAALSALPGSRFISYRIPENDYQAVIIQVLKDDDKFQVYVNPYTLDIMKTIAFEQQFMRLLRTFHGELLAGNVGSIVVELAACWAIVLIISGLYLWWPRSTSGIAGILYPRLGKGGRIFWRDLHSVTGVWISVLALFLLISGLPWALVWGSALKELRQWNQQPLQQDWSLGRKQDARDTAKQAVNTINLDEGVLLNAKRLNLAAPVIMTVSKKNRQVWTVKSMHQNRPLRSNAWLDAKTGRLIKMETFQQRKLIDRIIGIGVAAHEGQLFGWFNQALGVFSAIGLIIVSISGFVLWRRRKPENELGAPAMMKNDGIANTMVVITLILALLLPVLAISLIVILVLEWLILRRFQLTRQWLGLETQ